MATQPNRQARTLNDREVKMALATLREPRHKAMFLLSVRAGLRAKEIAGLEWSHIDMTNGLLRLSKTKGGKFREVPMATDLIAALKGLREISANADYVFTNQHNRPGAPLTANAVSKWFRHLYNRKLNWSGYSSHSGRRTAITRWARQVGKVGASLKDVQSLAGHSNLATTSRYIDTDPQAQRKLVEL